MSAPRRSRISIVRPIHRTIWILVFIISTVYSLYAQESGRMEFRDSLVMKPPINQYLLHNFQKDIVLPPSLQNSPEYLPGFLHQSLTVLPSSLSLQFQQQIEIKSYWKQELAREDEYRTLKLILGSIEAGGTAYLLYEHIKKYGLK